MAGFRAIDAPDATELSQTNTATMASSGTAGVTPIAPTQAHGRSIVAIRLKIAASCTLSANTTLSPGTVGSLISELKLEKGNDKKFDVVSIAQLIRLVHIYAGTTLADVSLPASTNSPSATLDTGPIPWYFRTDDATPKITLTAGNFSGITNATAGTLSLTVEFYYSQRVVRDDKVVITTAAAAKGTATDINVAQDFTTSDPVVETWIDLTTDASLTYQSFASGDATVFQKADSTTLNNLEQYLPNVWSHIAGFLLCRAPPGTLYASQGATPTLNKLIINLGTSRTPTYYLVISK